MKQTSKNLSVAMSYLAIILLVLFGRMLFAQSNEANTNLTLPWSEFKNLLNLDEDKIVIPIESYRKMLAQTGITPVSQPPVNGGQVILTRKEFTDLVNKMKPQPGGAQAVPFDFLMTRAVYNGKLDAQNAEFSADFQINVLKDETYLKIPLFHQTIALKDILVDGRPGLIVAHNGYHTVVLRGAGEHTVRATFSLRSTLNRGPQKLDFATQLTPITLLNLEIPLKDIDVDIPQAQQLVQRPAGNGTRIAAVLGPGNNISIRWRNKIAAAEKLPAKIYSEVYNLLSIEDDALKVTSDFNYNILHSEVDAVRLAIPDGLNVLSVTGEGVGEWQEITSDGQRYIDVPFTYGKKGRMRLYVRAEKPIIASGMATAFSGPHTLEIVREIGYVGIELNTSAEVIVTENTGMERIAITKLPATLTQKTAKPLMQGFKYLKHPNSLVLDIKRHEKIAVPIAAINKANMITLFTEDGKVVHRLVYDIRNTAKQFLEIQLPEESDVWSVFVDKNPVESSRNSDGKLLVPLIRSRTENNQLKSFPVEVIYAQSTHRFDWFGRRTATLPTVDLMTSQLIWSVYVPGDFGYHYFSSTLEKEEMIRGINIFSTKEDKRVYNPAAIDRMDFDMDAPDDIKKEGLAGKLYKGKNAQSSFRNVPMEEAEISGQMANELQFGGRMRDMAQNVGSSANATGVLPIQINIPTGGQVYRFARTIINSDDPLTVSMVYSASWVRDMIRWCLILLVLIIIYIKRNNFKDAGRRGLKYLGNLQSWMKDNEARLTGYWQSMMAPVFIGILFLLSVPYSLFLSIFFFLLFFVNVIDQFRRRRQQQPAGNIPPAAAADNSEVIELPTE